MYMYKTISFLHVIACFGNNFCGKICTTASIVLSEAHLCPVSVNIASSNTFNELSMYGSCTQIAT